MKLLDENRPLTAAVITPVTKARGERKDESGPVAKEMLEQAGYEVVEPSYPMNRPLLKTQPMRLADGRWI